MVETLCNDLTPRVSVWTPFTQCRLYRPAVWYAVTCDTVQFLLALHATSRYQPVRCAVLSCAGCTVSCITPAWILHLLRVGLWLQITDFKSLHYSMHIPSITTSHHNSTSLPPPISFSHSPRSPLSFNALIVHHNITFPTHSPSLYGVDACCKAYILAAVHVLLVNRELEYVIAMVRAPCAYKNIPSRCIVRGVRGCVVL